MQQILLDWLCINMKILEIQAGSFRLRNNRQRSSNQRSQPIESDVKRLCIVSIACEVPNPVYPSEHEMFQQKNDNDAMGNQHSRRQQIVNIKDQQCLPLTALLCAGLTARTSDHDHWILASARMSRNGLSRTEGLWRDLEPGRDSSIERRIATILTGLHSPAACPPLVSRQQQRIGPGPDQLGSGLHPHIGHHPKIQCAQCMQALPFG